MLPATAEGGARGGIAARGILAALVGSLSKMIQTCGLLSANTVRNIGVSGLSDTDTLLASIKNTRLHRFVEAPTLPYFPISIFPQPFHGPCGKPVENLEVEFRISLVLPFINTVTFADGAGRAHLFVAPPRRCPCIDSSSRLDLGSVALPTNVTVFMKVST